MSDHPELGLLIEALEGSGAARDAALRHLRDCRACRRAVAVEEPTALFALLGAEPVLELDLALRVREEPFAEALELRAPLRGQLCAAGFEDERLHGALLFAAESERAADSQQKTGNES